MLDSPVLTLDDLAQFDPRHPQATAERDCCCPLCGTAKRVDAAHRSLSYNAQSGLWSCHRCHARGRLRDFWPERDPADPKRGRAGANRAAWGMRAVTPPPREIEPLSAWSPRLGPCVRRLEADCPGTRYLAGRGIPAPVAAAARVRYAPGFGAKADGGWRGRPAVVFPLRDFSPRPPRLVACQGRYIDGKETPRMQTFGSRWAGCFATDGAFGTQSPPPSPGRENEDALLVVTEAPIDALSLATVGVPAIALCGCEGFPAWLASRLRQRGAPVVIAFDADEAGDAAAVKLTALLAASASRVVRLRPSGEKDWNAALVAQGPDTLSARIAGPLADLLAQ